MRGNPRGQLKTDSPIPTARAGSGHVVTPTGVMQTADPLSRQTPQPVGVGARRNLFGSPQLMQNIQQSMTRPQQQSPFPSFQPAVSPIYQPPSPAARTTPTHQTTQTITQFPAYQPSTSTAPQTPSRLQQFSRYIASKIKTPEAQQTPQQTGQPEITQFPAYQPAIPSPLAAPPQIGRPTAEPAPPTQAFSQFPAYTPAPTPVPPPVLPTRRAPPPPVPKVRAQVIQPGRAPKVDKAYKRYVKQKETNATYAYNAYDPLGRQRGQHIPFGQPVAGQDYKHYPKPGMSELGQSDACYDFTHRSEAYLPQVPGRLTRAVYGTQNVGGTELPIHGPAPYTEYYTDWFKIGKQFNQNIPRDQPLPDDELQFIESYGITFHTKLGSGGYATVWHCQTTNMFKDNNNQYISQDVACKVLSLSDYNTRGEPLKEAVDQMLNEAEIQKDLIHDNVVRCGHVMHVHDQVSGFPFCRCLLFMELCTGDLKTLITTHINKKFDETEAHDMFKQVVSGLKYLHGLNVVHMDLKVHNVMYVKQSNQTMIYKLADFGLSSKFDTSVKNPEVTGLVGTYVYMAPEQRDNSSSKVKKAKPMDIYGAGLILAESLSGFYQYPSMLREIKNYSSAVHQKWGISQEGCRLLLAMTNKNPKRRPTIQQVSNHQWFQNNQNNPPVIFT